MIKTLIDLKAMCIAAEKSNRKLRSELDRDNVALIESGMRDRKANSQPEQRARLFGKFSFKEKNQSAPLGNRDRAHARGVSDTRTHEAAATSETRNAQSPALLKLLSTDHLQFRQFSRAMLLEDVQLLTRYQQKLEAETKQLKLETVRVKRNRQQINSRVGAPSRPQSAPALDKACAVDRVENECHVALKLASVLERIRRDKSDCTDAGARDRQAPEDLDAAHEAAAGGRQAVAAPPTASTAALEDTPPPRVAADFCLPAREGAAGTARGERLQQAIYDVLIRNGSCRC